MKSGQLLGEGKIRKRGESSRSSRLEVGDRDLKKADSGTWRL